jgi:hypothetical protein
MASSPSGRRQPDVASGDGLSDGIPVSVDHRKMEVGSHRRSDDLGVAEIHSPRGQEDLLHASGEGSPKQSPQIARIPHTIDDQPEGERLGRWKLGER